MSGIFARKALLQKGWADNVRLQVEAGRIVSIATDTAAQRTDVTVGIALPGLCNAHSHAFQRALAGRTEERSPAGQDNFWSWRERMYELARRIDPESLEAIARQAYSEMLESGYTAVVEFHYLHRPTGGETAAAMFAALARAATATGIRLTYAPVLYERGGFDVPQPEPQQALFAMDVEEFLAHHAACSEQATDTLAVGIAAHSLRAVSPAALVKVAAAAGTGAVHLHIAEQQDEVEQCLAATGQRPVQWLLDNLAVDASWCLVHATHMDDSETRKLAESGATVCLCPSTEGNLGDGLFPLREFLAHGGHIAIGTDSHATINPFEELRWLEYGQRLATQSRNVAAVQDTHVGAELFSGALAGGARASGVATTGLEQDAPADLVTLHDADAMFVGHTDATLLDALVFSGYRLPIERVMVHGEWRVVAGDHVSKDAARAGFAAALQRLGADR